MSHQELSWAGAETELSSAGREIHRSKAVCSDSRVERWALGSRKWIAQKWPGWNGNFSVSCSSGPVNPTLPLTSVCWNWVLWACPPFSEGLLGKWEIIISIKEKNERSVLIESHWMSPPLMYADYFRARLTLVLKHWVLKRPGRKELPWEPPLRYAYFQSPGLNSARNQSLLSISIAIICHRVGTNILKEN